VSSARCGARDSDETTAADLLCRASHANVACTSSEQDSPKMALVPGSFENRLVAGKKQNGGQCMQ